MLTGCVRAIDASEADTVAHGIAVLDLANVLASYIPAGSPNVAISALLTLVIKYGNIDSQRHVLAAALRKVATMIDGAA
jgi:hypothetical protein